MSPGCSANSLLLSSWSPSWTLTISCTFGYLELAQTPQVPKDCPSIQQHSEASHSLGWPSLNLGSCKPLLRFGHHKTWAQASLTLCTMWKLERRQRLCHCGVGVFLPPSTELQQRTWHYCQRWMDVRKLRQMEVFFKCKNGEDDIRFQITRTIEVAHSLKSLPWKHEGLRK